MRDTYDPPQETWAEMRARQKEERTEILRRVSEANMSMADAARQLGLCRSAINELCKRYKVEWKHKKRAGRPSMLKERKALADQGMTIQEGADALGVSLRTLRAYSILHVITWSDYKPY